MLTAYLRVRDWKRSNLSASYVLMEIIRATTFYAVISPQVFEIGSPASSRRITLPLQDTFCCTNFSSSFHVDLLVKSEVMVSNLSNCSERDIGVLSIRSGEQYVQYPDQQGNHTTRPLCSQIQRSCLFDWTCGIIVHEQEHNLED